MISIYVVECSGVMVIVAGSFICEETRLPRENHHPTKDKNYIQ